ncbi:MAG: AI-2E family transporter [Bdellovibrionales bacterium]|nr:AI-2E family transporter [Bdellovibrionales bacterium]
MTGRQARVLITLFFAAAFVYLAWGFFVPLTLGAAIALLLYPLFDYLRLRKNWRPELAASLLTLGVTVLLILPSTLLSIRGVRYAAARFSAWKESPFLNAPGGDSGLVDSFAQIPFVSRGITWTAEALRMDQSDVLDSVGAMLKNLGLKAADFVTMALSSLPTLGIGLLLLILGIYFFLADGDRVARFFRNNSVFPDEQTEEIFARFGELCRAVLLASLVSGIVQSIIYVVGGAIGGVKDLVVIGFTVFVSSFIPVIGSSPVTFGLAAYTIVTGSRFAGFSLLIAAFVASVADNFVRPIVLKGGANLHPLIAIVALFGGLQIFGFAGVFIGPILAGMFFVFLDAQSKTRHLD